MPKQSYTKREDGRYRVVYKGKAFYGKTQGEAIAKRDAYRRRLEAGLREEAMGKTVIQYCLEWLPIYKSDVTAAKYNQYAYYLDVLCKDVGGLRMQDVTLSDIQRIFNAQSGKSKDHLQKFCSLTCSVFESAVEDGLIIKNPCNRAKRPDGPEGSHRALEQWERTLVEDMSREEAPHDFAIAAMLMLYAGLRRGELIAFNIDRDVDFDHNRIYVREAASVAMNQPILKAPKSKAGIRDIPLFEPLKHALKGRHGYVLTRESGEIMSATAFREKMASYLSACETHINGCHKRWYGKTKTHKAIVAAGGELPPWKTVGIRAHDFRHSFCSMLYDAGVDIKTAQKWMGHADEKMILRIYAHLSAEKETKSQLAVENMLKGSKQRSIENVGLKNDEI